MVTWLKVKRTTGQSENKKEKRKERNCNMGKRLFVGSLSFNTTEAGLESLFSGAGTVDAVKVIFDRDTGRSKGYGFVEMSSESEAAQAISMFNGYALDGRNIAVNEAKPQEDRPRGGGGGYGNRGGGGGGYGGNRGGGGGGGGRGRY
jgi:RNA recognition motif-containing protein